MLKDQFGQKPEIGQRKSFTCNLPLIYDKTTHTLFFCSHRLYWTVQFRATRVKSGGNIQQIVLLVQGVSLKPEAGS